MYKPVRGIYTTYHTSEWTEDTTNSIMEVRGGRIVTFFYPFLSFLNTWIDNDHSRFQNFEYSCMDAVQSTTRRAVGI